MLLHVLLHGHRLLDGALVNHRGVEQVNTVDVPHGNADVRCVEPALVGADGYDVAVLDGIPVEWGVAELLFGDVNDICTGEGLLSLADGIDPRGIGNKHGVLADMRRHVVDA